MHYSIDLRDSHGERYWFDDVILPGLFPDATFDAMECQVVESLGLCAKCTEQCFHCHILDWIGEYRARKLCPILFHDVVRPTWKLSEIV